MQEDITSRPDARLILVCNRTFAYQNVCVSAYLNLPPESTSPTRLRRMT
jgi:hypothetical protein